MGGGSGKEQTSQVVGDVGLDRNIHRDDPHAADMINREGTFY